MPRTTTLECPGCPPLRALTFDELGLIKVVESRGDRGIPQVIERWGDPDSSKCLLAASIDDRKKDPLLAVARKNGMIELLNPLNGETKLAVSNGVSASGDDTTAGLHLFRRQKLSGSRTLLTCTTKGHASMKSIEVNNFSADNDSLSEPLTWKVSDSGDIFCLKVDESENYAVYGGKGVEINMWDIYNCTKIWTAKPPPKDSLGIFTPTWFTSVTFLTNDDHRKIVAGTNSHQVRLYDISAQRRPVMSFDFRETPIKAVIEDQDGNTVYIANGSGDIASVDIRKGKLLGCFLGKCSGSIRSMAKHAELPVIASCGLDGYLRLWDTKTRQLLSAVFLKQHLSSVVFDCNFINKEVTAEAENANEIQIEDETVALTAKREKASKGKEGKKEAARDDEKKRKLKSKKKRIKSEISDDF